MISSKVGDYKPLCYFPEFFSTTIQPINTLLDIAKYQGRWFEIARVKTFIEKGAICTEETYTFDKEKGYYNIHTTIINEQEETKKIEAKGYIKNRTNTFWKVYFNPIMAGNYFVLDLDPNYQWALVGEPCADMLWIMSKTRNLDQSVIDRLVEKARQMNFAVD